MGEPPLFQRISQVSGTVLVADDQLPNRELMEELLGAQGLQAVTAPDGVEALHQQQQVPIDLAILDVMAPHLNGFEVCETIKGNPNTYLLPVILVTGLSVLHHRCPADHETGSGEELAGPAHLRRVRETYPGRDCGISIVRCGSFKCKQVKATTFAGRGQSL